MRREVADHAIALVEPEVHARGGDEVDLAHLPGADQLAHLVDGGAVHERVARHEHHAGLLGAHDQVFGVRDAGRQRLLHQDVLTGLQCPPHELVMGARRGRDRHRLNARIEQQLIEVRLDPNAWVTSLELVAAVRIELAQADETKLGPLENVANDVRPPVAEADDCDADRRCDHAWPPRDL